MEAGVYNLTIKGKLFKKHATVDFSRCDKIVKGVLKVGERAKHSYEVNGKYDNNRLEFYGSYVVWKPHFVTVSNCTVNGNTFDGDIEFNGKKKKVHGELAAPVEPVVDDELAAE